LAPVEGKNVPGMLINPVLGPFRRAPQKTNGLYDVYGYQYSLGTL
jgi:hypothetical protein